MSLGWENVKKHCWLILHISSVLPPLFFIQQWIFIYSFMGNLKAFCFVFPVTALRVHFSVGLLLVFVSILLISCLVQWIVLCKRSSKQLFNKIIPELFTRFSCCASLFNIVKSVSQLSVIAFPWTALLVFYSASLHFAWTYQLLCVANMELLLLGELSQSMSLYFFLQGQVLVRTQMCEIGMVADRNSPSGPCKLFTFLSCAWCCWCSKKSGQ